MTSESRSENERALDPEETWGQGTGSTHPASATDQPIERVSDATAALGDAEAVRGDDEQAGDADGSR